MPFLMGDRATWRYHGHMLFSDPRHAPACTLAAELRDYPEWHRGRERYGVWIVPVLQPELISYIEAARRQLADLLHPCPRRQPHLTVFVCGFPQPARRLDDDFTPAQLARQLALLETAAERPCPLPLARPDSFASAAVIPVGDPQGRLAGWRALLERAGPEIRQAAYVPHVTLGLYRRCVPADVVRQRLAVLAAPPVSLAVDELRYVTYKARRQFGPLRDHHRLALGNAGEVPAAR